MQRAKTQPAGSGTQAVGMAAKDQPFCWITNIHTTKFGLGNILVHFIEDMVGEKLFFLGKNIKGK
jgi:hypothetical protein